MSTTRSLSLCRSSGESRSSSSAKSCWRPFRVLLAESYSSFSLGLHAGLCVGHLMLDLVQLTLQAAHPIPGHYHICLEQGLGFMLMWPCLHI
ncbi:hypothetical protein E2C01_030537 [Portunus trituberculatus]|uniref:Uncharacterized protein n=1 Tax=Portunus trituberculatus TaxID=210409 RepID=A0A5B7EW06_PORTR|nr:hypothetical protein [Portunus trituberculatus]